MTDSTKGKYSVGYRSYALEWTVINNDTGFAVSVHPTRKAAHKAALIEEFRAAIAHAKSVPAPDDVHPLMHQAYIDGMEGELEMLVSTTPSRS